MMIGNFFSPRYRLGPGGPSARCVRYSSSETTLTATRSRGTMAAFVECLLAVLSQLPGIAASRGKVAPKKL